MSPHSSAPAHRFQMGLQNKVHEKSKYFENINISLRFMLSKIEKIKKLIITFMLYIYRYFYVIYNNHLNFRQI